jgi:hypothetical protein
MNNPETKPVPLEEIIQPQEASRFGDVEKILEIMQEGEIVEIGKIEDIYPNVSPHTNVVEVVDVRTEENQHANEVLGIKIQKGGEMIRCVFKPADGENAESKKQFDVREFYPHECAAYMVSDHFGFDVVPPTLIREINGRIGSLQLFIDHDYYEDYSKMKGVDIQGEDFQKIALLDWILANCERHEDNLMVNREDPSRLIAIDHGIVLSGSDYFGLAIRGPSLALTWDNLGQRHRQVPIPENLLGLLSDGLAKKDDLSGQMATLADIHPKEIEMMWERVEKLISSRTFLSKENFRKVVGYSWLAGYFK